MALLLKNKHIINSSEEEELLNIYTTMSEAVDTGKPCKVIQVEVDGEMIKGYIGCTDELDTKKASSKRVMVDGVEYAERKYMGIKDMSYYMINTYPDTYKTLTEITEDMLPEDTSDATIWTTAFGRCENVSEFPYADTRNATQTDWMYEYSGENSTFPNLNLDNCTNIEGMFFRSKTKEIGVLNTRKVTYFYRAFQRCSNLVIVKGVDFSQAKDSQLSGITVSGMFNDCYSLRSITFNNLPIGTTERTLRSKCGIPSTVTEIIMNYRSE